MRVPEVLLIPKRGHRLTWLITEIESTSAQVNTESPVRESAPTLLKAPLNWFYRQMRTELVSGSPWRRAVHLSIFESRLWAECNRLPNIRGKTTILTPIVAATSVFTSYILRPDSNCMQRLRSGLGPMSRSSVYMSQLCPG